MNAVRDLAVPDEAPAKLVEVAALGQDHVTFTQEVAFEFIALDGDSLDLPQVEMTILHVGDTQIWDRECILGSDPSPLCNPSLDIAAFAQRLRPPALRNGTKVSFPSGLIAQAASKEPLHHGSLDFARGADELVLKLHGFLHLPQ